MVFFYLLPFKPFQKGKCSCYAQYFALINLDVKLQLGAKASFSLLLNLLDQGRVEERPQVRVQEDQVLGPDVLHQPGRCPREGPV